MTLLTVEFITKISLLLTDCQKQRNNNTVQTSSELETLLTTQKYTV